MCFRGKWMCCGVRHEKINVYEITTFILKGHTTEGCYHQVRCTWHPLIGEACRLYRILWLKERWLCMYGFMLTVSKNTILHEQSVGQYLWPIIRCLRYRENFYFCSWGITFKVNDVLACIIWIYSWCVITLALELRWDLGKFLPWVSNNVE